MGQPARDQSRMIPTRLGRLCVRTAGDQHPPAVLWHSLFVDSTTWQRVQDPLAARRRLVLIDGPSHGQSEPARRLFTLQECAGAALEILDQLAIETPVDWVGNAWGGHVGILLAAARPDRCRSLVTIGTPVHALRPTERWINTALVALYGITGPIGPLVKLVSDALLGPHAGAGDPVAAHLVATAFRRPPRRGMALAMRSAMLNRPDLTLSLPAVTTVPTLFAAGIEDRLWLPAEARTAAARLPRGAWAALPGAGHLAPLLQSAPAVVALLTRFWDDPLALTVQGGSGAVAPATVSGAAQPQP